MAVQEGCYVIEQQELGVQSREIRSMAAVAGLLTRTGVIAPPLVAHTSAFAFPVRSAGDTAALMRAGPMSHG